MKLASKFISVVTAAVLCCSMSAGVCVSAEESSVAKKSVSKNISYAYSVTESMSRPSYWLKGVKDPDRLLMTEEEIKAQNESMLRTEGTHLNDFLNLPEIDTKALGRGLRQVEVPEGEVYINGMLLENKKEYFNSFKKNITGGKIVKSEKKRYGICVSRADMCGWPTSDFMGWSADDPDNEAVASVLNVNDPFVIKAVTADGKYYYGMSTSVDGGWVRSDKIAVCSDRDQWLDAWYINDDDDFVVVTQDKIILEPSRTSPKTSETALMLGTVLKQVKDAPDSVGERRTWNNYVVYLPTRSKDGSYKKEIAMIPQHYKVSSGYLPMTARNILDVAFSCLGNRYGWGGSQGSMDCSLYCQSIYRCFGLYLPRNTSWQPMVKEGLTDISGMTADEKKALLDNALPGTLLYMKGHVVLYLGKARNNYYVISAVGSCQDVNEGRVSSINSIAINSLYVLRGNGATWLDNLTYMLCIGK